MNQQLNRHTRRALTKLVRSKRIRSNRVRSQIVQRLLGVGPLEADEVLKTAPRVPHHSRTARADAELRAAAREALR